jgi:HSP20 family molecular chaperone IbpA
MERIDSELPKIQVEEKNKEIIVKVYISGISINDIELEVKEDFIKIDISKTSETGKSKKDWVIEEWENFSFSGQVSFPAKVIPAIINRSYNGKILEIKLKKA